MKSTLILLCCILLTACNSSSENHQNIANLKVQESVAKGIYHISATHSEIENEDNIALVFYEVTNLDTNEIIKTISATDHHKHHQIFLPTGTYNIAMEISFNENEDFDDSVDASVRDDSTLSSSGEFYVGLTIADGCEVWCSEYNYSSIDATLTACILTFEEDSCSSTYTLPLYADTGDDYLENVAGNAVYSDEYVTEDTLFCIRAIGAAGSKGDTKKVFAKDTGHGGSRGLGGFTQIITSRAELDSYDLSFLLGFNGTSSLITTSDISDNSYELSDDSNLLLVAAGGGSGANGHITTGLGSSSYDGGDGGDGAVATATEKNCVFAKGNSGGEGNDDDNDDTGYTGGGGGSDINISDCTSLIDQSSYASAGTAHSSSNDGQKGFGGIGGSSSSDWYNNISYTTSSGMGGDAERDAYGGGGSGGGAGGNEHNGGGAGGGGGGSAIANKMATLDDDGDWCKDDVYTDALAGDNEYGLLDSQYGTLHFIYKIAPPD